MARRNNNSTHLFKRKTLGILLIIALLIQFVLPAIKLGNLQWISTFLYLFVALILILT
ncbi:MAG: hypothetical protein ACOCXG_01265 [Nanoarchaeota archaeon]